MQEKILAKLKEQRGQNTQVSDKTLEIMAKTWANVIKDDEALGNIDFTEQINSLQGNIGHIAKQVKEDTEKLLKKPEPTPTPPAPKPNEPKPEDMPEWAKALIDQNKQNAELLAQMQGEKITTTRSTQLQEVLKDVPEQFKQQVTNNFNRMSFADDADFEAFKTETSKNVEGLVQLGKEQGVTFSTPPPAKRPENDGRDTTLSKASQIVADAKKKD